jgi:uncharacterized protein
MPSYLTPGVYIEEVATGAKPIESVSTLTAAFIGVAPKADAFVNEPRACNNWSEFVRDFCTEDSKGTHLAYAVYGYFTNGGRRCYVVNIGPGGSVAGDARKGTGVHALASYDEPSTICAPGFTSPADQGALIDFCENNGYMFAVLDGPERVTDVKELTEVATVEAPATAGEGEGGARRTPRSTARRPRETKQAACYFPWLVMKDPFGTGNVTVPPSGHMAGIYAFNDVQRGVHKAPANYPVRTAIGLTQRITREQQGVLNQAGINCIRFFSDSGIRVWGARTLAQDAQWRYVNVRRFFNMAEKSLERGTQWVVFEPNDQVTRNSVIRDCTSYLRLQWLAGALVGAREQAFFVKCDSENNPQEVIDAGRLVVDIGIAPSKPAEFICFRIGQWSGATEVKTA